MMRACLDCGVLLRRGNRCQLCRGQRERARGSPRQRGYGRDHMVARRALAATLPGPCYYCGDVVTEQGYVAAHVVDGDPSHGWVAAHASCNRQAQGVGQRRVGGGPVSGGMVCIDTPARLFARDTP